MKMTLVAIPLLLASQLLAPQISLATGTAEQEEMKAAVVGQYAHFDIVAYVEKKLFFEMKTLVITYGLTDLFLDESGNLIARDRYCHASHKANLPFRSIVPDAFTRAIIPKTAVVEVQGSGDDLTFWRPETPTGIGVRLEKPTDPLPTDPKDPRIADDDNDGKPGVTVKLRVQDLLDTEIYIARREIFAYRLQRQADASLSGYVVDHSEQLVLGSPWPILRLPNNPTQHPDPSLSPMVLVPLDGTYDCDRMMNERDSLLPPEPEVWN